MVRHVRLFVPVSAVLCIQRARLQQVRVRLELDQACHLRVQFVREAVRVRLPVALANGMFRGV